jgi:hypothetical protein
MATIVRTEKRKRGFFGWIFLIIFWAFNALMAVAVFGAIGQGAADNAQYTDDLYRGAHAAGTAIGAGMLISLWFFIAAILGLFVLLTRGTKVIIETSA